MQRWSRQRPHNQRWTCKGVRQGSLCNLTYILPVTCKICSKILWIPIQLVCTSSENSNALESELHRVLRNPHMVMLVTKPSVKYLTDRWSTSLEKMPMFTRAEMNEYIARLGKSISNIQHHSVPMSLRKVKTFLKDEYLREITAASDDHCFLKTHLSQENTWIHCIRNISCSWRITRCQSYWLWKLYLLAAVKCPHTKFHVEACSDPNFLMVKISDTQWRLKTDPAYLGQVWGQMDGTGVKWCDFIVYTSKGIYIEQIAFDPVYWGNLKNELLWYYFEHFAKICISRFP